VELGDLTVSERMRYDRTFKGYRKTELRANPPKFYDVKGLAFQASICDWVGNGCFLIESDDILLGHILVKLREFKVRYKVFECKIITEGKGGSDIELL
jgi:hypothetical protein